MWYGAYGVFCPGQQRGEVSGCCLFLLWLCRAVHSAPSFDTVHLSLSCAGLCVLYSGAFCVVPGSHKANLPVPQEYLLHPDTDPSMVALEVKASDAIFFTENLRHGGLTNHTDTPRLTLHVGYGPRFFMSQNIATMDEPQFLTPSTIARYSVEQLALFPKASLVGRDDAKVLLTLEESKAMLEAAAAARL